jgi:hypothetical protein
MKRAYISVAIATAFLGALTGYISGVSATSATASVVTGIFAVFAVLTAFVDRGFRIAGIEVQSPNPVPKPNYGLYVFLSFCFVVFSITFLGGSIYGGQIRLGVRQTSLFSRERFPWGNLQQPQNLNDSIRWITLGDQLLANGYSQSKIEELYKQWFARQPKQEFRVFWGSSGFSLSLDKTLVWVKISQYLLSLGFNETQVKAFYKTYEATPTRNLQALFYSQNQSAQSNSDNNPSLSANSNLSTSTSLIPSFTIPIPPQIRIPDFVPDPPLPTGGPITIPTPPFSVDPRLPIQLR